MNTNSISSANGRNVQLLPRLANLFRSGRDASQAKAPEVRNSDYRAQDHVAYHTDGTYSHGKPIGGETQFGIEGRVPTPAFGMTRVAIGIYMLNARVAAFAGETLDAVRAQGGRVFDARYAQLKAEFEGRIAAARRLIEPLESQAEAVRLEANGLPAVIRSEGDKFCLPQDWRLLALVGLLVLWGFVTYSEWINAAARQLYLVQDWGKAKAATAPWMAVGVVLELILISAVGIAGGFWRQVWRITSVTSIFLYAGFYAFRYGASPDAGVASTIAAAMNGTTVTETGKFLDQGLYFGQLLFGLVCGATLLE